MKHLSLAARYRPQTFAQVTGQDMVKAVLSRAVAEDRPAPAYLLSGTRGVGKTTIARIFAKALNCQYAPAPEPCNECEQCRKITQGLHVDVAEIDGASNNGVNDVRALRETIGYAPMEGRYKVFIIDEAHMLSTSAFNALLKTLEEPPRNVVFILASTEAHKFPVTILSRCQHFVFRHLAEDALNAHLVSVLQREGVTFEESAVRLLARRAAGSVRDSMSLLDQALALGGEQLTAEVIRQAFGLAGQEIYERLFEALHRRDCAAVVELSSQILAEGIDIGFFLRELSAAWRNLFLLRQGGAAIVSSLRLPEDESTFLQSAAARFSAGHLHAAWQLTLDAQRGIVQNPEPAAALELLLLNLALLPQLLPLEQLPQDGFPVDGTGSGDRGLSTPARPVAVAGAAQPSPPRKRGKAVDVGGADAPEVAIPPKLDDPSRSGQMEKAEQSVQDARQSPAAGQGASSPPAAVQPESAQLAAPARASASRDWQSFCAFCADEEAAGRPVLPVHVLRGLAADWQEDRLRLTPRAETLLHQVEKRRTALEAALTAYGAGPVRLELISPSPTQTKAELMEGFTRDPRLQDCLDILKAKVTDCGTIP
ncbi:MAG: DNA polymerase III subunit gamma/tau [Desulfovibrio sp.]|nr:DNA polymerase III subunit gamma/tau [Desulfovibrio sp.]